VHHLRPRAIRRGEGPLQTRRAQPRKAHSGEHRHERRDLVHDLLGVAVGHRIAHLLGDEADHLPVLKAGDGKDRLIHPLNAPLAVGKGPVAIRKARGGEDDVSVSGRLGEEYLLDDEEVQGREGETDTFGIGVGLGGVLPQDVKPLDPFPTPSASRSTFLVEVRPGASGSLTFQASLNLDRIPAPAKVGSSSRSSMAESKTAGKISQPKSCYRKR
jgi:hypothetical protein